MTNEEKAIEIANEYSVWAEQCKTLEDYYTYSNMIIINKLKKMAHWKDERQMVFLQRLVLKNPNPAMLELLQREIQQLKTQL